MTHCIAGESGQFRGCAEELYVGFIISPFYKQHSFLARMVLIIQEDYKKGEKFSSFCESLTVLSRLLGSPVNLEQAPVMDGWICNQSISSEKEEDAANKQRLVAKTTIHFAKVFASHIELLSACLPACLWVTRFVTPVGCTSIQLCAAVGRILRMLASSHEINAQRQFWNIN